MAPAALKPLFCCRALGLLVQGPGGFCKSIPEDLASRLLPIPAEAQTGFAQSGVNWDKALGRALLV